MCILNIISRAPMLALALPEFSQQFQYHKPAGKPLSYLPPTRAKVYAKRKNTSTKHIKSHNEYLNIISRAPILILVPVETLQQLQHHKPANELSVKPPPTRAKLKSITALIHIKSHYQTK